MMGSSPGSQDGDDDMMGDHNEKKRQPGVKRACNECRQQKVSQQSLLSYTFPHIHSPFLSSRTCPVGRHLAITQTRQSHRAISPTSMVYQLSLINDLLLLI